MNQYLLIPAIEVFFCLVLMAIVIFRGQRNTARIPFLFFLASMTLWGTFIFLMRQSADTSLAFMWEQPVLFCILSASIFFYIFTYRLTGSPHKRFTLYVLLTLWVVFSAMIPAGFVVTGMQTLWYGKSPLIGPMFFPFVGCAYSANLLALRLLLKHRGNSPILNEKIRDTYIIAGIFCMLVGATTDYLPSLGIHVYPLGIIGNLVFCVLATIAMLKYGLFEIKVVLRKGAVYLLAIVPLFLVLACIIYLTGTAHLFLQDKAVLVVMILGVVVLSILLRPIFSIIENTVDRLFFRGRYKYIQILKKFMTEPQYAKDLQALLAIPVGSIANAFGSSGVYLLLPSPQTGKFITSAYYGDERAQRITIPSYSLMILELKFKNAPTDINEILNLNIEPAEKEMLAENQVELAVPLITENRLVGIVLLRPKKSGELYTTESRKLLQEISIKLAMSIENARMYEDLQKDSLEIIKRILASMPDAVLAVGAQKQILLANRTFYECFGITGATLEGRNIQDIIPKTELTSAIAKVLIDGRADSFDMRYKISDYEKVFVVKVVPLRKDEVLVILADVSEDRVRQEKLYLTDRLASIGEMAAGVAHELNNPLTSIVGLSQILVMNEDLSSQYKEDVRDIHQEAQRAAAIVKNLLTFSRKHSPTKELTQVNSVLLDVLRLRSYEHKVSNIEVKTELDDELPEIMADYYQIQQLFLNIILNAESAMLEAHNKGRLIITSEKTNTDIIIKITDDGPGIAPENITRVFDPFFTTKETGKGTGLGLSICYGIVSAHRGKISAQSKLGNGATFTVELPIDEHFKKEDGNGKESQYKMAHSLDRR